VTARDGVVHINVPAQKLMKTSYASPKMQSQIQETIQVDLTKNITEIVKKIPGVKYVMCDVHRPYYA
jgi:hypothetical protein